VAAVVVALVFQVAWMFTRVALEQAGIAVANPRVIALSVAALAASYVTIAAAAAGLAKRVRGRRRLGAWIAMIGSLALVAGIVLYEALMHSSRENRDAMIWAIRVRDYGWSIADALAILGFAIAAGRNGLWLAPPALGIALMNAQPGVSKASWPPGMLIGLIAVKAVLLVIVAGAAERNAAPGEPEPERALAALRRCELCAWIWAALSPISALAWFASPTIYVALALACTSVAVETMFAGAAWSNARAAIPRFPRWPWFAAAMFSVWALTRTLRSWGLTIARHWGDLEATPLKASDWSAAIPGLLAALCALGALAILGHRSGAREAMRAALAAAAFSAIAFAVQCALPDQTAARVVCYLVASLAAIHAYRVARSAIHGQIPRARVL
jgi:hypothetical protein